MKHKARRYSLGTIFTTAYWSSVYSDAVSGVVVGDCWWVRVSGEWSLVGG